MKMSINIYSDSISHFIPTLKEKLLMYAKDLDMEKIKSHVDISKYIN